MKKHIVEVWGRDHSKLNKFCQSEKINLKDQTSRILNKIWNSLGLTLKKVQGTRPSLNLPVLPLWK